MIDAEQFERKRKRTTIIYYVLSFLDGVDNSCVVISLMYYLEQDIHLRNAKVLSSVIMALFAAFTSINGMLSGRYVDNTRETKRMLLLFIFLTTVGNLIYTLNNLWCIIIGRILCSFLSASRGNLIGELSKCYTRREFSSIAFIFQTCYATGFAIGPATVGLFTWIHFSIGWWHITPNNFIGVFMAAILFTMLLVVLCFVNDISKEFHRHVQFRQNECPGGCSKQQKLAYRKLSLLDILKNCDLIILIMLSSSITYNAGLNELIVNMIAIFTFKIELRTLSIITAISVGIFMFVLMVMLRKFFSTAEYNVQSFIFCAFSMSIACWFFVMSKMVGIQKSMVSYILTAIPIILSSISGLSNYSIARQILFRLVPENSVCFTEGVRVSFAKSFLIIGYFISGFIFQYIEYVIPCNICFMLTLLYLFFRKRELYGDLYPSLEKYRI